MTVMVIRADLWQSLLAPEPPPKKHKTTTPRAQCHKRTTKLFIHIHTNIAEREGMTFTYRDEQDINDAIADVVRNSPHETNE